MITATIPMPAIQKIRDMPLSNEQTNMAANDLDSQRLKDDENFRSYQLMMMQQQNQQNQFRQVQIRIPPPMQHIYMPPPPVQHMYMPPPPQYSQHPQQDNFTSFEENNQFRPMHTQHFHTESSFPWSEPPLPEYLDPKKSIDLKLIRKTNKKDTRCYTCKPRGKVKKHMINSSSSGKFVFHHDMHKRPVIIMTPARHIETIYELTPEELSDLFKSLKEFAAFWNIDDYQLSFNMGKWQNHEHFHCKIRISEKVIGRMRRDHFMRIKLEDRYTT